MMISLHTGVFVDRGRDGVRTSWLNEAGKPLAERIHAAMLRKLPLPDRGMGPGLPKADLEIPAVAVEFATITNPVEEGWLRSSTFLKRAAWAVMNGVKDYLCAESGHLLTYKQPVTI
jgi:N-acetylmuramoyl-L-alanine amidase